jgi:hypothetical protein
MNDVNPAIGDSTGIPILPHAREKGLRGLGREPIHY